MSEQEIQQFKSLFSMYCRQEVNAGHCQSDTCEWCPVNQAYEKIFKTETEDMDE